MADRLKIGVTGCGAMARAVHLPLLARRADVEISAIAEPDPGATAMALEQVPGARAFTTLDAMLAGTPLDAVIVAAPTGEHASAARAVFAAGCHLYLEKPLAHCGAEGARVLDAWRASGRVGMMGFNMRFNPLYRRLRELIRSGRAGRPVYTRSVFATAPRAAAAWKRSRATGGGALLDLGAHHIDLMRFLFSREPVAVCATLESRHAEDDTALLELELAGGPRVHGFYSLAAAEQDQVEVHGDCARLSVSRFTSLDVAVIDNPGMRGGPLRRLVLTMSALAQLPEALRARRSPLREPGYALALDCFLQAVRTGRLAADAADLDDGYKCLAIIEAAERCARGTAT
ncbi:MAG TPA: Gfo/Idh/MocA family oxidoreductase [Gemmatimonadaceae bacterium]|nr:Gfo/Idh/MocA family oxidoreductase [Gemmatimonadaceae bacterium]